MSERTVLVADDQESLTQALKIMLGRQPNIDGVLTVPSGQAAIDAVTADTDGRIKLVLTDVNMPTNDLQEVSGPKAAEAILKLRENPPYVVINSGGDVGHEDGATIMRLLEDEHVLGFLVKDISPVILREMINGVLSGDEAKRLEAIAAFANQTRKDISMIGRGSADLPKRFQLDS